eukprot:2778387-Amphidinium_carterae.1
MHWQMMGMSIGGFSVAYFTCGIEWRCQLDSQTCTLEAQTTIQDSIKRNSPLETDKESIGRQTCP